MPAYHFHRLSHPGSDPDPAVRTFFNDQAAIRWAIGGTFADGCDVWQATRYVGRLHGPAAPAGRPKADLKSEA